MSIGSAAPAAPAAIQALQTIAFRRRQRRLRRHLAGLDVFPEQALIRLAGDDRRAVFATLESTLPMAEIEPSFRLRPTVAVEASAGQNRADGPVEIKLHRWPATGFLGPARHPGRQDQRRRRARTLRRRMMIAVRAIGVDLPSQTIQ